MEATPPSPQLAGITMVDDAMAEILRQKTSAERLAIANGIWRFARDMIRATIAQEHSEWSQEDLNRAVARRMSHGAV